MVLLFPEYVLYDLLAFVQTILEDRKSDRIHWAMNFANTFSNAVLLFRIGPICFVNGLLELWAFDKAVIDNLTKDDILRKINEKNLIR